MYIIYTPHQGRSVSIIKNIYIYIYVKLLDQEYIYIYM